MEYLYTKKFALKISPPGPFKTFEKLVLPVFLKILFLFFSYRVSIDKNFTILTSMTFSEIPRIKEKIGL